MVQWVVGSIPYGGTIELFPSQCSTTGVTKAVFGMVHIKELLLLI